MEKKFSNQQINQAGDILKNTENALQKDVAFAKKVLTYFREIHIPILNTFQVSLRNKIPKEELAIVAMRLKRISSIVEKLKREPEMEFSRMQDIAGIRVILPTLEDVFLFVHTIKKSRWKHELMREYDYITHPKRSGYRSVHCIYKYKLQKENSRPESEGRRIEIQIRTHLQHIWATTVESFAIIQKQSFKAGVGDHNFLSFFQLLGEAFALLEEKKENFSSEKIHIFQNLLEKYAELELQKVLKTIRLAHTFAEKNKKKKGYFLMKLSPEKKEITIRHYQNKEEANEEYTQLEQQEEFNIVLVSLEDIQKIKKAYPNYFLDLSEFQEIIEQIKNIVHS